MTIFIHVDRPSARVVVHLRPLKGAKLACGAEGRVSWTNESSAITCQDCRKLERPGTELVPPIDYVVSLVAGRRSSASQVRR
jgi:hypothetical protein